MRLRPADRGPLYWLGCAAAHRGAQDRDAYELAELRFTEVVERWPGDAPSLVQRAHVRVRLGRPADALADLRSAERIGPLDAEARWVLAALSGATAPDVARRLGTAARSAMERAGATGPKGAGARPTTGTGPRPCSTGPANWPPATASSPFPTRSPSA